MKNRWIEILQDANGQLSSKRVVGILGAITAFIMALVKLWITAPAATETLILGILGGSFGLLGFSMMEKNRLQK